MEKQLKDKKNWLTYLIFSTLNKLAVRLRFRRLTISGSEHIPRSGPFVLVSNHISRWDGLVLYNLIARPSNFMVSPNELTGLQGKILRSMGSFPANPRLNLQDFVQAQLEKGEGVVIFPEGDVYRDGTTHPFKSGAARLALQCARSGITVPIIPVAINRLDDGKSAEIMVAPPVDTATYLANYTSPDNGAVRCLTTRLQREVCHLRLCLGSTSEQATLFTRPAVKNWSKLLSPSTSPAGRPTQHADAIRITKDEPALKDSPIDTTIPLAATSSAA